MSAGPQKLGVVYIGEPPPSNAVGIVGFVFSILGFLTCGFLSPLGFLISLVGLFKPPRGFALAGTIIGFLGTAWLAAVGYALVMGTIAAKTAAEASVQSFATMAAFEQGKAAIESSRRETGRLPDGIDGNKLVLDIKDGWQQPIHYVPEGDDSYVLRSAGPDGEFHTDDDLRSDTAYPGMKIELDDEGFDFGERGRTRIGPSGLRIEDGHKRIEINLGQIQEGSKGEGVELEGASIRVQDGKKKLSIELPKMSER